MVTTARHARVLGGAAALLVGLSGCVDSSTCAGIDVVSQVGVYVVQDGYGDLAGATYELCTRGECAKGELEQTGIANVTVGLPDDVDPDTAPVRLRVTRAGAAKPFIDDSVDVKLAHQSDGCGGGGYSQGLAYTKEDGLLPNVPKEIGKAWVQQRTAEATADPSPTASS
ncbi:hypothetical protein [Streptomyces europaeiscabiei]|uniref:hypothetical protein n=1 Tax=Streptomyces europaeiscabiei TaxID=146819 RepID=UPI000A37AEFD|nr:hypothetical protein [Streptomyces europaeiscabiei]MDX3615693.1 hypothetical protein [Streptomyces europaeiscabiei]